MRAPWCHTSWRATVNGLVCLLHLQAEKTFGWSLLKWIQLRTFFWNVFFPVFFPSFFCQPLPVLSLSQSFESSQTFSFKFLIFQFPNLKGNPTQSPLCRVHMFEFVLNFWKIILQHFGNSALVYTALTPTTAVRWNCGRRYKLKGQQSWCKSWSFADLYPQTLDSALRS